MNTLIAIIIAFFQFLPIIGQGDAQAVGRALAEQSQYTVQTLTGTETQSVFISVPLEEEGYLQLYSPAVLRAFTRAALELQADAIPEDAEVTFLLMNGRHIAGEAQLHMIGYVFTQLAGGADGLFAEFDERFRVIDLNVTENRVPPFLIDLMGWLVDCTL